MKGPSVPSPVDRLAWLDVTRVLCALMILGIHWLRACYKVGLFGGNDDAASIVMDYQSHTGGIELFHHVLIAGTHPTLSTWLTNVIGLLGGFGWEAVSALILISGFSLGISQRNQRFDARGWLGWYGKRARRVLVPFYLVASFFLAVYAVGLVAVSHMHGRLASIISAKMLSQFHTPLPGIISSHTLLFDPYNRDWSADFLAPAWWFVPAILLAYAVFPCAQAALRSRRGIFFLFGSCVLSIVSFAAADAGILSNETWYYIVLQESFDFSLGIFAAGLWLGPKRPSLERILRHPAVFGIAAIAFVAGNVANWSAQLRPIASILYGPSLVVMLVFVATYVARTRVSRAIMSVDPYDLYLVHQPFAFPIALAAGQVLHSYAVFVGWFVFAAIASLSANALTRVREFVVRSSIRPIGEAAAMPVFATPPERAGLR
jgi:hypothetical protein